MEAALQFLLVDSMHVPQAWKSVSGSFYKLCVRCSKQLATVETIRSMLTAMTQFHSLVRPVDEILQHLQPIVFPLLIVSNDRREVAKTLIVCQMQIAVVFPLLQVLISRAESRFAIL